MDELVNRVNEAFERLTTLSEERIVFEKKLDELNRQAPADSRVELSRAFLKKEKDRLSELEGDLKEMAKLAKKLQESRPAPEAIKPNDLAKHFRSLIEDAQREAQQPKEGEVAATIKSLDVEVKGLIVVEHNEARIVTPTPGSTVDPNQLSTIRMTFAAVPIVRSEGSGTSIPR